MFEANIGQSNEEEWTGYYRGFRQWVLWEKQNRVEHHIVFDEHDPGQSREHSQGIAIGDLLASNQL